MMTAYYEGKINRTGNYEVLESAPHSLQLEKACTQQQRPSVAK